MFPDYSMTATLVIPSIVKFNLKGEVDAAKMADIVNQTLHGLVDLVASQHANNRAVVFDDGEEVTVATYQQMQEAAGCMAMMLRNVGCGLGDVVGLYYENSVMLPSCILGILQAGASFLPLDPRAPHDMNEYLITSQSLLWILVPKSLEKNFMLNYGQAHNAQPTDDLSLSHGISFRLVKLSTNQKPHNTFSQSPVFQLAYVMHTSGTTGWPKNVRVPHQCIVPNITDLSDIFSINPDDVIFVASTLTFDPSIVAMFLALSKGASLVLVPDSIKAMPRALLDILVRNQVSILQATPTLISRFGKDQVRQHLLTSTSLVRVLAFGGETCPTVAQINQMRAADNTTEFYNLYGITEVSSWASCQKIDTQCKMEECHESILLGKPLLETTLEVRNENGQTITEGEGQVFIGSKSRVCLLNDETWPIPLSERGVMRSTKDRVRITDRGLMFVGRGKDQVKRNGIRVNLIQVKQRIEALQVVESCKVLQTHQEKLLLFCIPFQVKREPNQSLSTGNEESFRILLKGILPSHCLPDKVYFLEKFPVTLHGKVDKKALMRHAEEMEGLKREVWNPPTKGEMQKEDLAILWKEAAPSSTEPQDNHSFILHSGGDSFQAVRLTDAIESWNGRPIPNLLDTILHQTFKSVLKCIRSCLDTATDDQLRKSKRRKISVPNDIVETTAVQDSEMETCAKLPKSFSQNKCHRPEELDESDVSLQGVATQASNVNDSHDTSQTNCQPFASAVDPPVATDCVVVRRCSQLMATKERTVSYDAFLSELNDKSDGVVARGNQAEDSSVGRSVSLLQRWQYNTGKCVDASPLLVTHSRSAPVIYIGSHSHKFAAVSMATGNALWVAELGDRVESSACLSACGKKVIVGCYDNHLYVLDATLGTVHWKFKTNGPIKSSPVVDTSSSLVYVGSHDHQLYALDIEDQSCRWSLHCGGGSVFSSPIIHYPSSTVYVATLAGLLIAVNKETGAKKWSFNCSKPVFSSPMASLDSVVFGCVDGNFYCISHSGLQLWRFTADAPIFSSPCLPTVAQSPGTLNPTKHPSTVDSCVVFGSHDHHVYCLSLQTGQLCWKHKMPAAVYTSPFIFRSDRLCQIAPHDHCISCDALQTDGNLASPKTEITFEVIIKPSSNLPNLPHNSGKLIPNSPKLPHNSQYHCISNRCNSKIHHSCRGDAFVIVCSTQGSVVILDLGSGEVVTSCQLPGEVFSSPVVFRNCVVIGCRDDFVYCLEIATESQQTRPKD
ncbi:beta-alanine-activating enzyme-like [Patiria miniata]|uniref:Beta-alanine-activating enzyme n=1 Tax=Patiria miniata TaxID=46514 RepID=A0A913ZVN4_PATMI|nr:beta-alanine-activating enzyme-like [Patiria miniata]